MLNQRFLLLAITSFLMFFATACDTNNDNDSDLTGNTKVYTLGELGNSGVSGTATFAEVDGGSTEITLQLTGTPQDGIHPAHIHFNSAAEGGGIAVSLEDVDGTTGNSVTTVETTNAGDVITYEELLDFDGYINVHLSPNDLGTVVAQGDIGANELTENSAEYTLGENGGSGVSGTVTFNERKDGTTLAVIALSGTPQDGDHPAHIHENDAATGGPIAISFNNVDGETGRSNTQIETLDGGTTPINYSEIITFDGYVNIHLSPSEITTVVAQGDIGSNGSAN